MATEIVNTYETYGAVGNREELADKIWMITPEETPFTSLIGKTGVASVHPEWQTDTLATPDLTNNRPEGSDWTFQNVVATTRVGNYTQISDKRIIISRTQDRTSKAGRKSEVAREIAKKGVELRTDIEVIALSNQASQAGAANNATNRTTGGFRAWIKTNASLGSGGAAGGFNTSTKVVDAATNGTQAAFTKAMLDSTILSTFNAGGNLDVGMLAPYAKQVFSKFMSDSNVATQRYVTPQQGQTKIVAAADEYLSDFGLVTMVPNRQMARAGATVARNVFLIDASKVSLGMFDDIQMVTPAKTGDAEKRVLVTEWCLLVNNEAAQGVIADIFGLSAST
jgi:hypothetical protein